LTTGVERKHKKFSQNNRLLGSSGMLTTTPCCGKAPWRKPTKICVEIKVCYQEFDFH